MKGKDTFTQEEIERLKGLIKKRCDALQSQQKSIRKKMRNLGFYGRDDWGIVDCYLEDIDMLIKTGKIKVLHAKDESCKRESRQKKYSDSSVSGNSELECSDIDFKNIDKLRQAGFLGFVPVDKLSEDYSQIPNNQGVYLVIRMKKDTPVFVENGSGGYFKGKNPNVPIDVLNKNWVNDTCVLYVGKAGGKKNKSTLRKRLKQYLQFGKGKDVGHRGGRYIWQLKDAKDLLFCWKPLYLNEAAKIESMLVSEFKRQYEGKRPFANLLL